MGVEDLKRLSMYKKKFADLQVELLDGEELKHCIVQPFYYPEWAISNKGRVYSLSQKKWLVPQAIGNNREYWGVKSSGGGNPKVHQLVAYYFQNESDKIAIEEWGLDELEVHHIYPIDIPEDLKHQTKENKEARIIHCMKCNNKDNVVYQEPGIDHANDKRITNGSETIGEEKGTEEWSEDLKMFRDMSARSGSLPGNSNGSYYIYSRNEDGSINKEPRMSMKLKGTFE